MRKILNLVIFSLLIVGLVLFVFFQSRLSREELAMAYHRMFGEELRSSEPISYPYHGESGTKSLYLNLLKLALTDSIYDSKYESRTAKQHGNMWPLRALTMIGLKRLDNIQFCMEDAIKNNVPGDFIEAGAWRGGATIFMRAVLKANGETTRKVWVADSFEGLPPPDPKNYPADKEMKLYKEPLAVSEEQVKQNFERFGLLDSQVIFLKGFFKNSLPKAPIDKLAVLRIDADLYESTLEALTYLYPKLSRGGYVIIDDYNTIDPCHAATDFYRTQNSIQGKILGIDESGVYWQKS